MDLKSYLLDKCQNESEIQRVNDEYSQFESKKFLDVLKFLVYFVDTLRKNNVVWGLGRGSSVSSFCLFLIGVHKINPIVYDLDFNEFMR
jgi:DNA polymerase III alpha subunit